MQQHPLLKRKRDALRPSRLVVALVAFTALSIISMLLVSYAHTTSTAAVMRRGLDGRNAVITPESSHRIVSPLVPPQRSAAHVVGVNSNGRRRQHECPTTTAELFSAPTQNNDTRRMSSTINDEQSSFPIWDTERIVANGVLELLQFPGLVVQLRNYEKKVIAKLLRERPPLWRAYFRRTTSGSNGTRPGWVAQCREQTPECMMFSVTRNTQSPFYAAADGQHKRLRQSDNTTLGMRNDARGGLTTIAEARALFSSHSKKGAAMEEGIDVSSGKKENDDDHGESFLLSKCCAEHHALRRALVCWEDLLRQHQDRSSSGVIGASETGEKNLFSTEAESPGARPSLPWWLAFGSLLGPIRSAAYARVQQQRERIPDATVIPWDTDLDVMVEPSTSLATFVEKVMSSGKTWWTASQARRGDGVNDAATSMQCHATLAPENQQHHVHGDLLGFVFASQETPTASAAAAAAAPCPDNSCSRVEVWLRHEGKKTQRKALVFPLLHHTGALRGTGSSTTTGHPTPLVLLYGAHAVPLPRLPVEVLQLGYGEGWCRPCKHRTSACKNVTSV
jgi:hypothetical protein